MDASSLQLGADLIRLRVLIDSQISTVEKAAQTEGLDVTQLRDAQGNYILVPLLLAKAQLMNSVVLLRGARS